MANEVKEKTKKKNKKIKSNLISFDEELVPKHVANKILASEETHSPSTSKEPKQKKRKKSHYEERPVNKELLGNEQDSTSSTKQKRPKYDVDGDLSKKKIKKKRNNTLGSIEDANEKLQDLNISEANIKELSRSKHDTEISEKKKKKKKRNPIPELTGSDAVEEINVSSEVAAKELTRTKDEAEITDKKKKKKRNPLPELTSEGANGEQQDLNASSKAEKKDSIRARKRKRYAKLLEEKKLKTEVLLQEKGLNYLSKWKHSRDEWKFEKLRQIWLQHNMYDPDKIPQGFWDTLVEYFGNSKGKARDIILKDALKLIEENPEHEDDTKIKRARDIVQNLQE